MSSTTTQTFEQAIDAVLDEPPVNAAAPTPAPSQADVAEIRRTLDLLTVPGGVVEIRAVDVPAHYGKPMIVAGYFSDLDKAAKAAATLDARKAGGIYFTLNEIHRGLLAPARTC